MTSEQIQKTSTKDEIIIDGILVGMIEGLRFKPSKIQKTTKDADPSNIDNVKKTISDIVEKKLAFRIERLIGAPNDEIILSSDGYLRWRGEVIANLSEAEDLFRPNIIILADKDIKKDDIEKISDRLNLWLSHHINNVLEQIKALSSPDELNKDEKQALELTQMLSSHFGILPRKKISALVKGLDQDVRGKLRRLGIKFGAYHIYLPLSLKPAPRELALILWSLKNGGIEQVGVKELPQIILSGRTSFEIDKEINTALYELAGFKIAGNRAIRIDILERLANLIRPLIMLNPLNVEEELPEGAAEKNGFRVTVEMTSLLGCAGEDFSSILKSLGYRVKKTPIEITQEEKQELTDKQENSEEETKEKTSKEETPKVEELDEVKYDEVWYPASFRSEQNKQAPNKNFSKSFDKAPKKYNKNSKTKGRPANKTAPYKKKDKPFDPDSPFAALLALKNKPK